jgi:low temperature requirement protein LtrA
MAVATEGEREQRVTFLELFFDLVFVFAFTQVTGLLSDRPTWVGLGQGLLVLAALWWAWSAYAWLTNTINPEEGSVRLAMFASMGAMLVAALAVPNAFGDDALAFGIAYFVVRVLHLVLYAIAARGDRDLMGAVRHLVPSATAGPVLILAAAALDGVAQGALWAAALVIDFGGPALMGMAGWRVQPSHFVERYSLVIILALGESIVSIGIGAAGLPLDGDLVAAALLGLAVAAALWWAYFDVFALLAARKLSEITGRARAALARDSFAYLHLPLVAGVVLFALGVKKTLGHVDDPLDVVPAVALCGGVAVYFLGDVAFRLRTLGSLSRGRPVAAVACAALIPLATEVSAIAALAGVAGVCVLLIAYEAIRFREARYQIRHAP